jgi:hypothetical protein
MFKHLLLRPNIGFFDEGKVNYFRNKNIEGGISKQSIGHRSR